MYIRKRYDLGTVIDIENHYPGNFGAPGVPREKKRKRTPEDIARQNATNRGKFLRRLILMNFVEGDWHLILTHRSRDRPDFRTGRKLVKKFISAMRKEFKKEGIAFKYILVSEIGKRGQAVHHHLVIEDICRQGLNTVQLVKKLWTHGNKHYIPLYADGEYQKLAEYIIKKETKSEAEWCTYTRSRNLKLPVAERKRMRRKRWPADPKPEKGCYIIKESIVNGWNPVTDYPYQHYSMRRIAGQQRRKRGKNRGG